MAGNSKKHLIGNDQGDRVSLFHDGRVKVWSTTHLWTVVRLPDYAGIGEAVRLGIGEHHDVPGPIERREQPKITVPTGSVDDGAKAGTVCANNGTFVQFFADGSVVVGNDGRDIRQLMNVGRYTTPERGRNGVGGSVMIVFEGSYRPRPARASAYPLLHIPEDEPPKPMRLYKDEFIVTDET
ncbi:hypothetical protein AB0F65_05025 [Nocardia rhamnosiphila]|uniref:hypothetical protein n=1 Tax=Nocardia rhamnosiphila TaxID=426716 RepID=UPI0033E274FD